LVLGMIMIWAPIGASILQSSIQENSKPYCVFVIYFNAHFLVLAILPCPANGGISPAKHRSVTSRWIFPKTAGRPALPQQKDS